MELRLYVFISALPDELGRDVATQNGFVYVSLLFTYYTPDSFWYKCAAKRSQAWVRICGAFQLTMVMSYDGKNQATVGQKKHIFS